MITVTCKNLFSFENHQKSHHKNHKSELFACFHDFPATIQSYQAICQRTNRITSFLGKFHFIAESHKIEIHVFYCFYFCNVTHVHCTYSKTSVCVPVHTVPSMLAIMWRSPNCNNHDRQSPPEIKKKDWKYYTCIK